MKKKKVVRNILIIICSIILVFIMGIYVYIYYFGKNTLLAYKYKVYPNTYIASNNVSGMSDKELVSYINNLEGDIKNIKLNITVNNKNYNYTLDDIGVYINKEELVNKILNNNYNKKVYTSIKRLSEGNDKYSYKIVYSDTSIKDFVNNLKKQVDIEAISGELKVDDDRNLSYGGNKEGYSLDKDKVIEQIKAEIYKSLINTNIEDVRVINVKASGKKIDNSNKDLSTINTKIASFSTKYQHTDGYINLKKAAEYIDKVVVMPKEEFSFFDYAGPYDKEGYVLYDDLIGNGVCQASTTLYNAILLSGIKATARTAHTDKPDYVMGGADAMVASINGESSTDFKFVNTLDYPIYISSYLDDNNIYVDIWSNDKVLDNKYYEVESIALGNNTYDIYLYTYRYNQLISKDYLYRDSYKK